jgi:hypothetical protein
MLRAKDLPAEFWELALKHAVFVANRVPFKYEGRFQQDPYQQWCGKIYDYSKIRIFGSRCYVLRDNAEKDFTPRSIMRLYVGHAEDSNSYLCYIPEEN